MLQPLKPPTPSTPLVALLLSLLIAAPACKNRMPAPRPSPSAPRIVIDERGVLLDGTLVAKPGELKKKGSFDWKLPELHRRLKKLRAAAKEPFTGEVFVQAKPEVEFSVIKLVMYTCGLAGYGNVQFLNENGKKASAPGR
jgi:biopolymer transport protein ExbD